MHTGRFKPLVITTLAAAITLALGGCSQPETSQTSAASEATVSAPEKATAMAADNPFAKAYDTPFQLPPFADIKDSHFLPAAKQGMQDHLEEVDAIINNPEAPTFANTIEAYERSGKLLTKVQLVFYNLAAADTNKDRQGLELELGQLLSAHYDKVNLNAGLFDRINKVWQQRDSLELAPEERKLLEDTFKTMSRVGALLNDEDKAKLTEINAKISELQTQFGQNLLAETNGFELVLEESDLAGLSDSIKAAAKAAATQKAEQAETTEDKAKYQDKYLFTPHRSSMYPFLTYSTRRDLREQLYKAYVNRGDQGNKTDNKPIAAELASLRAQRAQLLGYKTHAHYVLEERMVKTPKQVYDLLMQLWTPALARAKTEIADMQEMINSEGGDYKLAAWDWWHYAEKVRKAKYDLDEAAVKPYLTLDNVINGAFDTANKLWGLSFTERFDMQTYHPDVRVWEVKDKDGSHLGLFLGDYFTRSSKRGGAWMNVFKVQSNMDLPERPIVVNVCNFPPPVGDTPSLLSFDQVATLFHEFGHGLHGLVTNTKYASLSGTAAPTDFTEFPAQIYEHWANEPQVLKTFAKHYQTGEVIPDELITKLQNAAKFNQGFANTEYLAASLLDMDWHTLTSTDIKDAAEFEKSAMEKIGLVAEIAPRYRSTYFSHIFAGGYYAAGYYSYVHSAVLDADGYDAFKETGDIFNQELAQKYRTHVLEAGATREAMELYKAFRGREPKIDALLRNRGLDGSSE